MPSNERSTLGAPVIACVWAQYGPYHFARVAGLQRLLGPERVHAVEIASRTDEYQWKRFGVALKLHTLCPDSTAEQVPFWPVFFRTRKKFIELGVRVCFVPSYFPKQSLAILLAAKSLKLKTVMMNETHAGTARAAGLAAWAKRRLIGLFDAALVGGQPQRRYFRSMGIPEHKIFDGYDAIDNGYFAARTNEVRLEATRLRAKYALPEHYFLSLGRFVGKKNLEVLIHAYQRYLETSPAKRTHLVMVGAGEEGTKLRCLCHNLGLPVYEKMRSAECGVRNGKDTQQVVRSSAFAEAPADRSECGTRSEKNGGQETEIANRKSQIAEEKPGVHFYGFRQIDENPIFYALADCFVLPSVHEEWGLVVNEAMASSLPVVVSEAAGCAEDLLEPEVSMQHLSPEASELMLATKLETRVRRNGFIFDPNSSEELGRVLVLIESCKKLRRTMGQSSSRIIEKFSCANFAKNALLAIRAAVGEPKSSSRALNGESIQPKPFTTEAPTSF